MSGEALPQNILRDYKDRILKAFLDEMLKKLQSGEATAADMAVALKTLERMEADFVAKAGKDAFGALGGALADRLPFAGSDVVDMDR